MTLPIITADQRLAEPRGIKGCIFGKSGIGKTRGTLPAWRPGPSLIASPEHPGTLSDLGPGLRTRVGGPLLIGASEHRRLHQAYDAISASRSSPSTSRPRVRNQEATVRQSRARNSMPWGLPTMSTA